MYFNMNYRVQMFIYAAYVHVCRWGESAKSDWRKQISHVPWSVDFNYTINNCIFQLSTPSRWYSQNNADLMTSTPNNLQ